MCNFFINLRRLKGQIKLRCYGIMEMQTRNGTVLKFACDDGINFINVIAFDQEISKVRSMIRVNELFILENFGVKPENPNFLTGTFGNFEITIQNSSSVRTTVAEEFPPVPYNLCQWKSISDAKDLPDQSVVGEYNMMLQSM